MRPRQIEISGGAVSLRHVREKDKVLCVLKIQTGEVYAGRSAELELDVRVEVRPPLELHRRETVYRLHFTFDGRGEFERRIDARRLPFYSYNGREIDLRLYAKLLIKTPGPAPDDVIEEEVRLELPPRAPAVERPAEAIVAPRDDSHAGRNFRIVPARLKWGMVGLGTVLITCWSLYGTIVYRFVDLASYTADEWLFVLIFTFGFGGMITAALLKTMWLLLRSFASIAWRKRPARIRRDSVTSIRKLLTGYTEAGLVGPTLRIIAYNIECGQRGDLAGSLRRWARDDSGFEVPSRVVVLYEQSVERIPPRGRIEEYFDGEVAFAPVFRALYPPAGLGQTHGIALRWKVQLMIPELYDHELAGGTGDFAREDFFDS